MKGQIFFKERDYDRAPKVISLLKTEHHYYGLTSIPALLNRNYFCRVCEKVYHEESEREHNCVGQNCTACRRGKKACPNFAKWVTPELYCNRCHIRFYGPECFEAHLRKKRGQRSVCVRATASVLRVVLFTRSIARRNINVIRPSVATVER